MRRAYLVFLVLMAGLASGCDLFDKDDDWNDIPKLPRVQVSAYNELIYDYNHDGTLDEIGLIQGYDGVGIDIDFSYSPFRITEEYTIMSDFPFATEKFEYKNIRQNRYGYITDLEIEYTYFDDEIEESENMIMEFEYENNRLTKISFSSEGHGLDIYMNEEYGWTDDEIFTLNWRDGNIYEINHKYWLTEFGEVTYTQDNGNDTYRILYSSMDNVYNHYMPAFFRLLYLDSFAPLLALAQNNYLGFGTTHLPSKIQYYDQTFLTYNYVMNSDGSVLMVEESNYDDLVGDYYYQYTDKQGRSEYVTQPQKSEKHRQFRSHRLKNRVVR